MSSTFINLYNFFSAYSAFYYNTTNRLLYIHPNSACPQKSFAFTMAPCPSKGYGMTTRPSMQSPMPL